MSEAAGEPSVETDKPPAEGGGAAARAAGRGGLAIAAAKVSFVLMGLAQQIALPRVLDEAGYGAVSRMLSIVSSVTNVVVAMSIQGVSRMVAAAEPERQGPTFRSTLKVHGVIALVVGLGFMASAGLIAKAVEAPQAARLLRVVAGVVLCYGLYAPLVGSLNGRRRFVDQAGLDIFYGVSRAALMITGAFVFARSFDDGPMGAAIGFVSAAVLIVPIAFTRSGIGTAGPGGPSTAEYLRFLLPVIAAQAGLNLLLQADFLLLSNSAGKYARLMHLDEKEADKLLGPYRASQLFAFLPYQLLMSVQFVLFPLLAKAHSEGDRDGVKRLTQSGVRTALVLTGLIAGSIASLAPHLMRFTFPATIAEAGVPFVRAYVTGFAALSILGVASSALASLRKEIWSMGLSWIAVALVVGTVLLTRENDDFGPELLKSTAYAAAGAMTVAGVVGSVLLYRAAGSFVKPIAFIRILAATAATIAIGSVIPWMGKLFVPFLGIGMVVVYVAILIAIRELTGADLAMIRNVVARRAKAK